MMVVLEVLNEEEKKRKLAVAAACLHVIEHGSATKVTSLLPNWTTTNNDATVKKTLALKADKPLLFIWSLLIGLWQSLNLSCVQGSWKGRILSLQLSSYTMGCEYWLEDPTSTYHLVMIYLIIPCANILGRHQISLITPLIHFWII